MAVRVISSIDHPEALDFWQVYYGRGHWNRAEKRPISTLESRGCDIDFWGPRVLLPLWGWEKSSCPVEAFAREQSTRRLVRRKALLGLYCNWISCSASQAPFSTVFPQCAPPASASLFVRDLATHAPWFLYVLFALHTRTRLLPVELAFVSFGFVLVRVQVGNS
jgi:hypothetical protein